MAMNGLSRVDSQTTVCECVCVCVNEPCVPGIFIFTSPLAEINIIVLSIMYMTVWICVVW